MSLVSVPQFTYPEASRCCAWFKGTPVFSTSTAVELASTNTQIGFLIQVPKAGNISRDIQWVAARRPRNRPAAPNTRAPVQTLTT